jgi:hypothetical protein
MCFVGAVNGMIGLQEIKHDWDVMVNCKAVDL